MTDQELFDRVATHLLMQGRRAMRGGMGSDYCAYRSPDGLTCAIGCLIPDERYDPELEGQSATSYAVLNAAGLTGEQARLASVLQHIHDDPSVEAVEGWASDLRELAIRFDLNPAVVDRWVAAQCA